MIEPCDDATWTAAGGDVNKLRLYRSIGDVAAFSDGTSRCLAAIHPAAPTVGAVGDWSGDARPRVAAERWLAARGAEVLRGPMELCTWFTYRVNLGPHADAPFLLEPTERPDRWLEAGYTPATHYASVVIPHDGMISAATDRAAALAAQGWTIEWLPVGEDGLAPLSAFVEGIDVVHGVASEAFADAYGFVPIPVEALRAWYLPYRERLDPRLIAFARAPSGEIAGFTFGVPDALDRSRGWFLVKTAAVRPRFHGSGVGTWLNAVVHQRARKLGYSAGLYATMWEGAPSNRWSRHGGRVVRRYAILEKPAP